MSRDKYKRHSGQSASSSAPSPACLGVTREQAATPSPQHSFPTLVFARLYLPLLARLNLSFCTRARVDFFARRPGLIAQAIYQNLLVSLSSCLPF